MRIVTAAVAAGAGAAVAGALALGALGWLGSQRWMRTATPNEPARVPESFGLSVERVTFPSRDGTPLVGWFARGGTRAYPDASPATVVLLHGLRSDGASMAEHAAYLQRAGYNVLLFDFRASGASGGDDVTFGARERLDALGALDYLEGRGDVDMRRVGLQGVSMGAVVALLTAARDPRVAGVVAEAPFSDFSAVVERSYAHQPAPLRRLRTTATMWTLNRRLGIETAGISAVHAARNLDSRPLLIIDDELDANVPTGSARAVAGAATRPAQLWVVEGAAHGAGHEQQPAAYERRVLEFWGDALRESRP